MNTMNETKQNTTLMTFTRGLILGAVLTALFAPRSGEEVRNNIKSKIDNVKDKIKEKGEEAKDKAKDASEDAKEKAKDASDQASNKADSTFSQTSGSRAGRSR
jgi:gas vesicle protein